MPGSEAILSYVSRDAQRVQQGTLQPGCASFYRPATGMPRGVVLMLHGWSAGCWQYIPLATALSPRGLHCYAARLPGHGACTPPAGGEDPSELPTYYQAKRYGTCAQEAFDAAQALAKAEGVPLYLMGFSGGGALAFDLLQRYPEAIKRAVLVAPLLRPKGQFYRFLFTLFASIPGLGFLTNQIKMTWGTLPITPPSGWVRPGHWRFRLGQLQAIVNYSARIWAPGRTISVPTQFIVTDLDDKADGAPALWLGRAGSGHHVWRFLAAEGVPHAMLTAEENPNAASREQVFALIEDFLLTGTGRDSHALTP